MLGLVRPGKRMSNAAVRALLPCQGILYSSLKCDYISLRLNDYAVIYRQMMKRASYRGPLNMIYLKPILLSFLLNICSILSAPRRVQAGCSNETTLQQLQSIWVYVICHPDILQQRFFFTHMLITLYWCIIQKKGIICHWKITKTSSDILPLYRNLI